MKQITDAKQIHKNANIRYLCYNKESEVWTSVMNGIHAWTILNSYHLSYCDIWEIDYLHEVEPLKLAYKLRK